MIAPSDSKKCILEIRIPRNNDHGKEGMLELLSLLHREFGADKQLSQRDFISWYMIRMGGQIKYLIEVPMIKKVSLERYLYTLSPDIEIREIPFPFDKQGVFHIREAKLGHRGDKISLHVHSQDPLGPILLGLSRGKKEYTTFLRIDIMPLSDKKWKGTLARSILKNSALSGSLQSWLLRHQKLLTFFWMPLKVLRWSLGILFGKSHKKQHTSDDAQSIFVYPGFSCRIFLGSSDHSGKDIDELMAGVGIISDDNRPLTFTSEYTTAYTYLSQELSPYRNIFALPELAEIVRLPTKSLGIPNIDWLDTKKLEPPHNLPDTKPPNTPIGISEYRGVTEGFGIKPTDRSRHLYIIGKTGMGKSTLLENMISADIVGGRGIGLIDPHGDLADTVLANIPKSRTNDIILFDPSDTEYPIGFNMLDCPQPELRPIVAGGIVSVFKRMFAQSWGPRLEYILRNTLLTLLHIPETTLISVVLMLTQESYRKNIVAKIQDPILIQFWNEEFAKMSPQMMSEAVNPILNKVGQFLSSPIIRNIVGQPKNPFSLRWIMDNQKILIVNLSKGKIGEDASALLGAMMVTKFQIEAMTRADMPEEKRKDFGLYVDEFQNFATDSFATILSEARKYQLSLTMANQYIAQMSEEVQNAVFGNVGSMIAFQVGPRDATILTEIFGGNTIMTPHDLMNLRKYDIYTKLLIDGMPSPVFSATTYGPIRNRGSLPPEQSKDVLLRVSREKYTKPREFVEKKIFEYAGKAGEIEKKYKKEREALKKQAKK